MEYVIIGLLVLVIVILLFLVFKKSGESNIIEKIGKLEMGINKDISDFRYGMSTDNRKEFDALVERLDRKLNQIDEKINIRLDANFEKTNKTFSDVLTRLTKIDEAQKKIDMLSTDIVSLQSVLTDKKTRGTFGEVNLNYILSNIFGENNTSVYELQKKLPNEMIVDAILYAPEPLGTIAIDSKFPLENYQKMTDKTLSKEVRDLAEKSFKIDMKKHIDDIANKYIIKGYTSNEAIMFLPAEAIFAEINAYHSNIITYAYNKKVWITSPTTLMSTLTVISMILKDMERDKYTKIIHEELSKLSDEFTRYRERWDKLAKSIDTVGKEVKDIHITTEKITKRFDSINNVEIEESLLEENKD
ncbi:MAG: DNA recombination protein RmuC [Mollicutes bacterium]|jgi:DNA recombination protein RmuC|nr:DNA recombination protein RmuC [Mollicutes bacterium]